MADMVLIITTLQKSRSRIFDCVTKHINMTAIEIEVKESMKKGELELVFKKYCGLASFMLVCFLCMFSNLIFLLMR